MKRTAHFQLAYELELQAIRKCKTVTELRRRTRTKSSVLFGWSVIATAESLIVYSPDGLSGFDVILVRDE